ncbi:tail fiber domain-containing protein [Salibaculum griseiflavum]|uniref:tail fiber domain-containing protein n=1 Tax=Salibaculum griseiflavum TaxID=1914409 RepID=UPI0026B00630
MKTLVLATTLAAFGASSALAGGMAPAIEMEPVEIVEETGGSSSNLLIPLILIALIAAAASTTTSGEETELVSDMRVKTDIVPVGTAANGLPLYQFRYIGAEAVFEGVMAQDVLAHTPEAVLTDKTGLMRVDYGMLGLEMKRIH